MKKTLLAVPFLAAALLPTLAGATTYKQIIELEVTNSLELYNHPSTLNTCLSTTDLLDAFHCVSSHSPNHFAVNIYNYGPKNYFLFASRSGKLKSLPVEYDSSCRSIFGMSRTPEQSGKLRINVNVGLADNVILYSNCNTNWTPFN